MTPKVQESQAQTISLLFYTHPLLNDKGTTSSGSGN
jgi:hypothetical protein